MNKNITIGVLGLVLLGSVAAASGVFASNTQRGPMGINYTPKRHEQMTAAFANNDYAAWKKLMAGKGATRVVTQENFARFTEMHNLMLAGKTDEANAIRQELGLGTGQGQRGQNNKGHFIDVNFDGVCDNM